MLEVFAVALRRLYGCLDVEDIVAELKSIDFSSHMSILRKLLPMYADEMSALLRNLVNVMVLSISPNPQQRIV